MVVAKFPRISSWSITDKISSTVFVVVTLSNNKYLTVNPNTIIRGSSWSVQSLIIVRVGVDHLLVVVIRLCYDLFWNEDTKSILKKLAQL